jgi:hypothetical protein
MDWFGFTSTFAWRSLDIGKVDCLTTLHRTREGLCLKMAPVTCVEGGLGSVSQSTMIAETPPAGRVRKTSKSTPSKREPCRCLASHLVVGLRKIAGAPRGNRPLGVAVVLPEFVKGWLLEQLPVRSRKLVFARPFDGESRRGGSVSQFSQSISTSLYWFSERENNGCKKLGKVAPLVGSLESTNAGECSSSAFQFPGGLAAFIVRGVRSAYVEFNLFANDAEIWRHHFTLVFADTATANTGLAL